MSTSIRKVNLFILGAQKCGTTTLFHNLKTHPKIHAGNKKEMHHFSLESNYQQGEVYYHQQYGDMNKTNDYSYIIDSSPIYIYIPHCANRIYTYNNKVKLVVLLREPIERAYSAWHMYQRFNHWGNEQKHQFLKNREFSNRCEQDQKNAEYFLKLLWAKKFPSFESMVEEDLRNIQFENISFIGLVNRGLYIQQILNYLKYFKRNQIYILSSAALLADKQLQLQRIFNFLEIEQPDWEMFDLKDYGIGSYQPKIPQPVKGKLNEFFHPHNTALFEFLSDELW
jgi:hypothetical protein